jgi:hypothetical protein
MKHYADTDVNAYENLRNVGCVKFLLPFMVILRSRE